MHTNFFPTVPLCHAGRSLHHLRSGPCRGFALFRQVDNGLALAELDLGAHRLHSLVPLAQLVDELAQTRTLVDFSEWSWEYEFSQQVRTHEASMDRLGWLLGERMAADVGLAPWLDAHASYRLLSWPNFREIGDYPQAAQLCALIARRDFSPLTMAHALDLPIEQVHSLLNCLSLCAALAPEELRPVASMAPLSAHRPRAMSMFARLGHQLGFH